MKNKILAPIFLFGACLLYILSTYNSILTLEQHVKSQHSQIERINQYRFDLIPRLTSLVKSHLPEKSKLLSKARDHFINASSKKMKYKAANKLEDQFLQFLVFAKNHTEYTGNAVMIEIMDELKMYDEQVTIERVRYNERVLAFNSAISQSPKSFIARIANIVPKKMIDA